MPTQALALALAASVYPPAVAAVIALGRGSDVRPRVFAFVFAAGLVTYAVGVLILYALLELGATGSRHLTPSAAIDLALGVLLILLALRLHRRRPDPAARVTVTGASARTAAGAGADVDESVGVAAAGGADVDVDVGGGADGAGDGVDDMGDARAQSSGQTSKIERYLQSRRLAFVLGITLYVLPSPIYIGAVKAIADAHLSHSGELTALLATVAVMLWMVELPMLMLLVVPARASAALERINLWFARHGRSLAIVAAGGVGVYLMVKGLVGLV